MGTKKKSTQKDLGGWFCNITKRSFENVSGGGGGGRQVRSYSLLTYFHYIMKSLACNESHAIPCTFDSEMPHHSKINK